jgi:hypothetical protein
MTERVITSTSVGDFFHRALNSALLNQHIDATPHAVHYLVHLLSDFSRSDRLYEKTEHGYGLKPLALLYADAVHSTDPGERQYALRRLGDVALFIAGLFSHSLSGKAVDVDYYVAMGGGAYAELSFAGAHGARGASLSPVFKELSGKFAHFVDALAEVGKDANFNNDSDLLRSYENWLRTGSERAAQHLRREGIEPSESNISRTRH